MDHGIEKQSSYQRYRLLILFFSMPLPPSGVDTDNLPCGSKYINGWNIAKMLKNYQVRSDQLPRL